MLEEEGDSETDQGRGETSEAERDRDSDVSLGEEGGVPEIMRARKTRVERSWRRVHSPVTTWAEKGRAHGLVACRGSSPSPFLVPPVPVPSILTSPVPRDTVKNRSVSASIKIANAAVSRAGVNRRRAAVLVN